MAKPQKYRSKVRDEPRTIYPLESGLLAKLTGAPEPKKPKPGTLNYRIKGPVLQDILNDALAYNDAEIAEELPRPLNRLTETFDLQYELACQYFWLLHSGFAPTISPVERVLTPCFHKSLVSLFTAFNLTRQGLWGPGRPLIRHAFESLVIAKFCSTDNNSDVFDKWVDGVDLYFTNAVLKKIEEPDTEQFRDFWSLMSDFTHSSIYASQPEFLVDNYMDEVELNFVFLEMMMECKCHLLISHIVTSNMRYYQNRYKDGDRARELKDRLNANYREGRSKMGKDGKELVRQYRGTWKVKV